MRSTFVQVPKALYESPSDVCSTTASCAGAGSEIGSDFGNDSASCLTFPLAPDCFNSDDEVLTSLLERSLMPLEPITQNLCVVLAQPDLTSPRLRSMGFIAVKTLAHFTTHFFKSKECPPNAEALILPSVGDDTSAVQQLVSLLNQNPNAPTIIVVLLASPVRSSTAPQTSAEVSVDFGRQFASSRSDLLQAGADDVIGLCMGEVLRPHRIMEILQRSEYIATKITEIVQSEVRASEDRAARKLQVAYRRFLMHLPGKVLENIPFELPGLVEEWAERRLVAVGEYKATKLLGSGAFGQVYQVKHREFGIRALKVVPKSSLKNAHSLFSLDREICLLMHIDPHPNVVQALEVLHGPSCFHIIMEYAGLLHLHAYTKRMLESSGATRLDDTKIERFSRQQMVGIHHLHMNNICHRDLKPNNWIVNDAGESLKLADFGLAAQIVGSGQLLKHSCGSLPFVAPEVYKMGTATSTPPTAGSAAHALQSKEPPPSYDGLAADMWSFGVGCLELALGPYAVEKMLGWRQRYPADKQVVLSGLRDIPDTWRETGHVKDAALRTIIGNVLVVDPEKRWTIGRVVGREGFDSQQEVRPPRVGKKGGFSRSAASFARGGITARVLESQVGLHARMDHSVSHEDSPAQLSLCQRMGGHSTVAEVVNRMMDLYLWHPGYGECLESSPSRLQQWRKFLASAIPRQLDEEPGSEGEAAVHHEIAAHHAEIDFLSGHLQVMLDKFRLALGDCYVDACYEQEALERFAAMGPFMTQGCKKRMADASVRCSRIWKAGVVAATCRNKMQVYAVNLESCIRKHEGLKETTLAKYDRASIVDRLEGYLRAGTGDNTPASLVSPILAADDGAHLGPVLHLSFCNLARDAFHAAGMDREVISTLHLVNLRQWNALHSQVELRQERCRPELETP